MAYAMTKQGSLDNCVTYEFICDAVEDMNAIEDRYRTIGTVAIVLSGESGLEVYIAGSDKQWNSLSSIGGSAASDTAGLSIYICAQDEVSEGVPDVELPDEQTLYLVPAAEPDSGNLYDEYIYVDEEWEKFSSGSVGINLPITYQSLPALELNNISGDWDYSEIIIDNIKKIQNGIATLYIDQNQYTVQIYSWYQDYDDTMQFYGESSDYNAEFEIGIPYSAYNSNDNINNIQCSIELWFYDENEQEEDDEGHNIRLVYSPVLSSSASFYLNTSEDDIIGEKVATENYVRNNYVNQTYLSKYALKADTTKKLDNYYTLEFEHVSFNTSIVTPSNVWTDGDNVYYSTISYHYVLNKATQKWERITFQNHDSFEGAYVWKSGDNVYYSKGANQFILDKATRTWQDKTWNGLTNFDRTHIWTDGTDIYYSQGTSQYKLDKTTDTWNEKIWYNDFILQDACFVWTDGQYTYYSYGTEQLCFDSHNSSWFQQKWNNIKEFYGNTILKIGETVLCSILNEDGIYEQYILNKSTNTWNQIYIRLDGSTYSRYYYQENLWTDGNDTYYCYQGYNYKLVNKNQIILGINGEIKPTSVETFMQENTRDIRIELNKKANIGYEWIAKIQTTYPNLQGSCIWTDETNYYYSEGLNQYVFDKSTSTWSTKVWTGLTNFYGYDIWTNGTNIYYSSGTTQYTLDKMNSTWTKRTWSNIGEFYGRNVWTDKTNIYYSSGSVQKKLSGFWSDKTWTGLENFLEEYIWTDKNNVYYSDGSNQYILDKSTSTWTPKTWNESLNIDGSYIWTDRTNYYYSNGSDQYILDELNSTWVIKEWAGLKNFYGNQVWTDGDKYYYSYSSDQYELVGHPTLSDYILMSEKGAINGVAALDNTGKVLSSQLPFSSPSSTDGTYILQATVTNGTPTYSWVSLSSLSGVTF